MAGKIIEYQVFSADLLNEKFFNEKINGLIRQGWQPFGGVSWLASTCYAQAMVKYA